jgi:hypothetical protein
LTLAAIAIAAPSASAGPLVSSAEGCADQPLTRPFLPWLDLMRYELAPGGAFEGRRSAWKLRTGAEIVNGNESHYVRSRKDSQSLALPPGSSAISPPMCVGLLHPTLRAFARNEGSLLSAMRVTVLFEDALGNIQRLPIGVMVGQRRWAPTLPVPVVANLLPLLPHERTAVAFKFAPLGAGGAWRIDDVYVDPMRRS